MIETCLLRAALYVEQHLGEPLTVERLAEEACISMYHFHRLFTLWAGEPVNEYVRRLRLEHGAYRLRATTRPIGALALECGYASADAFGRAFSARFGESPRRYRQRWAGGETADAPSVGPSPRASSPATPPASRDAGGAASARVVVQSLPAWRLVCVRHRGRYQEVGRAWGALAAWASEHALPLADAPRVGVSHDDPAMVEPAKIRYDACYAIHASRVPAVEPHVRPPVFWRAMPAGDYAIARHHGPYHELGEAYRRLFLEWLPRSGRYPANAPVVERYRNSPREVEEAELSTDLLLPLL